MQNKVAQVNLEYGMPTVEAALQKMKNSLMTYKAQGTRAVILIHGYGSSGAGGSIKSSVTKCLGDSSMKGIVRAFAGGEQWFIRKRELLAMCGSLEDYERKIKDNNGITVVILR